MQVRWQVGGGRWTGTGWWSVAGLGPTSVGSHWQGNNVTKFVFEKNLLIAGVRVALQGSEGCQVTDGEGLQEGGMRWRDGKEHIQGTSKG